MMSMVHFGVNVTMDSKEMAENVMTSMNALNTYMSANSIQIAIIIMAVTRVNVKMDMMILILMETVKILMNVMFGHIAVRLHKIVIIKYHFISVPVTLATSMIRMVIALIWTSVLMVITIVTQMPNVSIVTAAIHVAVIQDIARVSKYKIYVLTLYFGIFCRLETLIKVIWWITVWLKIRKKVAYVYKLTNVLTILIIAT